MSPAPNFVAQHWEVSLEYLRTNRAEQTEQVQGFLDCTTELPGHTVVILEPDYVAVKPE